MKKLGRLFTVLLIVAVLTASVFSLSSCYIVDSGKLSEIEGSYMLSRYSTNENEIEANTISLYIMIKSDGMGYYAYSDKDTPLHYSELRCRFTQDEDEPGKYSYVELNFGNGSEWYKFGVNASAGKLSYRKPNYKGNLFEGNLAIDYYIDVDFERVDTRTTINYMRAKLGEGVFVPYGGMGISGTYYCAGIGSDSEISLDTSANPFVYLYLDIDLIGRSGRAWYMLKSDEVEKTAEFDVAISDTRADDGTYTLTLGDKEISATINGSYVQYIRIPYPHGEYTDAYIEEYYSGYKTESEIIADIDFAKLSYENQKDDTVN